MIWDQIYGSILWFLEEMQHEIGRRSFADWIHFCLPILILCEIPRYYVPVWVLLAAKWLGYSEEDPRGMESIIRRAPLVSVVIAGRNEEATIEKAIRSLLQQDYPNLEIIVVDDNSEDRMYEIARRFARRGLIRLIRNSAGRGRSGRPSATNIGLRVANGEFVLSVDADCTFDRNLIEHAIAPFADPKVGVVAGNVVVRNQQVNLLTRLQTLEYAGAIDIWKRWTNFLGCTLQASGAIGVFRRSAVMELRGWDAELAEDTDISLRMIKAGWKVKFAPRAVALTEVPETLKGLKKQRHRWDRGTLRTIYKKHGRLLKPSVSGWVRAFDLWWEYFFFVLATFIYPFFLLWVLFHGPVLFAVVLAISYLIYSGLAVLSLVGFSMVSTRLERPWSLLFAAIISPLYKEVFRWVRLKALFMELLRLKYKDSFLPDSAWHHAPRY